MNRPIRGVSAAIIAGGGARRFGGQVKALIEIDGQSILERQLAVLGPLFAEILIAANDPHPFAHMGMTVVPDRVPGHGPLAGLAAALAHATHPSLFAVACDMPYIHTRAIELLLTHMSADVDIVVPIAHGRPQPLFAIYSQRCLRAIELRLDDDRNAISGLIGDAALRVCKIPAADFRRVDCAPGALTNINSPTDLP